MSLRNVLIVAYHFPPSAASGSFRMLGFARHLPRHGWRATVVAPPSLPWEPVDPGLLERVPPETEIHSVPFVKNRLARKLAPVACWLPWALRACHKAIRQGRPEALLTSGPPQQVHWLGYWLRKRYGLPWAADFRDPWYPSGQFERGDDLASWQVSVQESLVMHAADAVIANAPGACRALRSAYPGLRSKFVTLPNGYDREAFVGAAPPSPPLGRPIRLVHTGAIYVGRDPRPVLDAIRSLSSNGQSDLTVSFFGPPPESALDLAAEARLRGIEDRVEIAGQVSYARCLQELLAADVLLLMDSPGRTVGVPAKLYEYLGAGRPVLALGERNGDLAWVLRQSGLPHRIVAPDDPLGTTAALADLVGEVRSGFDHGPPRDLHRFSREAIAGRLATLLGRCTARAAGAGQGSGAGALCEAGFDTDPDSDDGDEPTTEMHVAPVAVEGM